LASSASASSATGLVGLVSFVCLVSLVGLSFIGLIGFIGFIGLIGLCLATVVSQQGGISVFKFPKRFLELSWAKTSLFFTLFTFIDILI
jgi:hypothetical protein